MLVSFQLADPLPNDDLREIRDHVPRDLPENALGQTLHDEACDGVEIGRRKRRCNGYGTLHG